MVKKLPLIKQWRELNELWIQKIPWPNMNPNIITILQIIPSLIIAFYFRNLILVFWMLALVLFLDLADGAVAKKHKRTSKQGYLMDLFFDRLSETMIFLPLMNYWLALAVINSLLSMISLKKKVHVSIPLRQAYGIYILFILLS